MIFEKIKYFLGAFNLSPGYLFYFEKKKKINKIDNLQVC